MKNYIYNIVMSVFSACGVIYTVGLFDIEEGRLVFLDGYRYHAILAGLLLSVVPICFMVKNKNRGNK